MNSNARIIVVLILLTWVTLAGITYASQERKPVGPPIPPEEKPKEEDCPDALSDASCPMEGFAMGIWANETWGAAAIICDGKKAGCVTSQNEEFAINQAICESVKGCKLTAVTDYKVCGSGSSNKMDCTPKPGLHDASGPTWYKCTVKGYYNITDYECSRPEE